MSEVVPYMGGAGGVRGGSVSGEAEHLETRPAIFVGFLIVKI